MTLKKILAIRRNDCFSPNSVDKDLQILQAASRLVGEHYGVDVDIVDEDDFATHPEKADLYLTMGRRPATLVALAQKEHEGSTVVNSSRGVAQCQRSVLEKVMRKGGIAMPPFRGDHGIWLKRGDAAAHSRADVVYCPDDNALAAAIRKLKSRGITDYVTSAHVEGDVVKFYGVADILFRCYYPGDDGISKFGDEKINGRAHHYPYDEEALRSEVHKLARLTGVAIYGGDVIIDPQGHFYIIDFNDWPSFARCCDEAAEAICQYIINK